MVNSGTRIEKMTKRTTKLLGSLYPRSLRPVYKSPFLSSAKRAKGKEGRVTSAHCIGEHFLAVALYRVFQVQVQGFQVKSIY